MMSALWACVIVSREAYRVNLQGTTGVPRMKEIINVAKNIKSPAVYAFLKDPYMQTSESATEVMSHMWCLLDMGLGGDSMWG